MDVSRGVRVASVLQDPLVRSLVERVEAAYAAEPDETRIADWRHRVRLEQRPVWLAWIVVSQVIAERLGEPSIPWQNVLPDRRAAAVALRRESGLGEMPPGWRS